MGIRSQASKVYRRLIGKESINYFLDHCHGVIHIGANTGQERFLYASKNLSVLWIEPISDVYRRLVENLVGFPDQQAIQALLLDVDGTPVTLNISSNDGLSSSILPLKEHLKLWDHVTYVDSCTATSKTLPTIFAENSLNIATYDALVLDTQGSEMLILKGAVPMLPSFKYILVEIPDFEAYEGCPLLPEFVFFMKQQGFRVALKTVSHASPDIGAYYDIVFERNK